MSLVHEIESRMQALNPSVCICEDESHHHIGHAGNKGGGHYALLIVSEAFASQSRIQRQRSVNALVQDLFPAQIHALSIRAFSQTEWEDLQKKESV